MQAFARIENHYFVNKGFFNSDSFLLDNIEKIKHIKTIIVQVYVNWLVFPIPVNACSFFNKYFFLVWYSPFCREDMMFVVL